MPAKTMVAGAHPRLRDGIVLSCARLFGEPLTRWSGIPGVAWMISPSGIRVGDALSVAARRGGCPIFFNTPVSGTQVFDSGSGVFWGIFPNLAGKALGVGHAAGAGLVFT
jgi:hypothetical protein